MLINSKHGFGKTACAAVLLFFALQSLCMASLFIADGKGEGGEAALDYLKLQLCASTYYRFREDEARADAFTKRAAAVFNSIGNDEERKASFFHAFTLAIEQQGIGYQEDEPLDQFYLRVYSTSFCEELFQRTESYL